MAYKCMKDKMPWNYDEKSRPAKYMLVEIKDEDGRRQKAWWSVGCWDYGVKKVRKKVIAWRFIDNKYHENNFSER